LLDPSRQAQRQDLVVMLALAPVLKRVRALQRHSRPEVLQLLNQHRGVHQRSRDLQPQRLKRPDQFLFRDQRWPTHDISPPTVIVICQMIASTLFMSPSMIIRMTGLPTPV
jgi:hypothetical protein